MPFDNYSISNKKIGRNTLHLNIGGKTKKIRFALALIKYRDKDTRQIVYYIPSLEITSYGASEDKAKEMMKFSLHEYCHHLTTLTSKNIQKELSDLGWKQHLRRNKEYSTSYVDVSGQLKNFNAVADEVELLTVEAD